MRFVVLIWLTIINLSWVLPLSKGDQYQNRLQKWYFLAGKGEWEKAAKLENKINNGDINWFKEMNKSEELKKRLNELMIKTDKNADDWMKIAYIQKRLGKMSDMKESVKTAYEIDPIRKDIEKVYFSSAF